MIIYWPYCFLNQDKVLSENGEVKMQIIALESAIDNMKFTLAKFEVVAFKL